MTQQDKYLRLINRLLERNQATNQFPPPPPSKRLIYKRNLNL